MENIENEGSKQKLIWIDPNLNIKGNQKKKNMNEDRSEDYDSFYCQLRTIQDFSIKLFSNVEDGMKEIKTIKFQNTTIILYRTLMKEFFEKLIENIEINIFIIPRIVIFTDNEKQTNEIKCKVSNYPFFNNNYIYHSFDDLINSKVIINNDHMAYFARNERFIFDYVEKKEDLIIPLNFHKFLTEPNLEEIRKFNNFLYDSYKDRDITFEQLLGQTFTPKVPKSIIMKYWLRAYFIQYFAEDLNYDLRTKIGNKFDVYVRLLYYGLKRNLLKPVTNKKLYRGGIINDYEIQEINKYLSAPDNSNLNIPKCTCFSKIYLTFSSDEKVAYELMKKHKDNLRKGEHLVIIEIEENDANENTKDKVNNTNIDIINDKEIQNAEINEANATNVDLKDISVSPNKKEVLFFPYSCFEVPEKPTLTSENYYILKMRYLGKYKKQFTQEELNNTKNVPKKKFHNEFLKSKMCDKVKSKEIIKNNPGIIENYIIATYKIETENINKEIQIINCCEKNKKEIESGIEIFINNKKEKFSFKKIFDKAGKYYIKFNFIKLINNLSHLFENCSSLYLVDFDKLEMTYVQDISFMFSKCFSLIYLKLSNTNEINNLSNLFFGCKNLLYINLFNFNSNKEIEDCSYMFYQCTNLEKLEINLNMKKEKKENDECINVCDVKNMFTGVKRVCEVITDKNSDIEIIWNKHK